MGKLVLALLCAMTPALAASPPREPGHEGARKLRICPQEWIVNRMPGVSPDRRPRRDAYFILNGKRREMSAFDMTWVRRHCRLRPQSVY